MTESPTSISTPSAPSAVEVRGLHKRFPGTDWVVENIDLAVAAGELLSVLGPSGCGKTTLLRLIAGFEAPDRGEVVQSGQIISRPGWALDPEHRKIGMVFQEYTLFPHLSVRENVQFGIQPNWWQKFRADQSAWRTERRGLVELMEICGLGELAERYPHELSGGQQQRVALARALATRPEVILMDEPFSSLDSTLRQRLRSDVRDVLRRTGTTAILVTHDQEEAINMGDRLAVMSAGRLEQIGAPEDVLRLPANRFVAGFVGMNRFVPGRVEHGQVVTELGSFPVPSDGAPAALVDVLLRPAQVHLQPNGDAVQAQVRQIQYVGGQPLYTLALPSGLEVQALLPDAAGLRPGDRTGLMFKPTPLVLFAAE